MRCIRRGCPYDFRMWLSPAAREVLGWPHTVGGGGGTPPGPRPPPPPPPQTKVTIVGEKKFIIGKMRWGHFRYTNFCVPAPPPPLFYYIPACRRVFGAFFTRSVVSMFNALSSSTGVAAGGTLFRMNSNRPKPTVAQKHPTHKYKAAVACGAAKTEFGRSPEIK